MYFNIAVSNSASADSFLSCSFSARRSLSSFASSAFMPPYWLSHRCQVEISDLELPADIDQLHPASLELVALR